MKTVITQLKWGLFNLIDGELISEFAKLYGEWSEVEVQFFKSLLSPQDNIIEVGSNIGTHSVPLAKFIPNGKLFCFEPQRIIFQTLCCNLSLNNLYNVFAYNVGVANENGIAQIQSSDYKAHWNYGSFSLNYGFSTEAEFNGHIEYETIDIVRLDTHPEIKKLSSLKFLKIDVEGFEISVLQGAADTIQRFQPIIFIEAHLHSSDKLLNYFKQIGYECYWFISERYQEENYFNNQKAIEGYDFNFVCYPLNSSYVIPDYLSKAQPLIHHTIDKQKYSLPLISMEKVNY